MRTLTPFRTALARLWNTDRPLTAFGLLMVMVLAASAVGLLVDPRAITGAPAWLKPAKFAASAAIYSLTLAWVFTWLPNAERLRRRVSWITIVVFALEVGIIDVQAWRGTTSHFNRATPLDAALFSIMGGAILVQTLASAFVIAALWKQRFDDEVMGTALRAGMLLTFIGAMSGGLMTVPTSEQRLLLRESGQLPVSGAHTVGAPDGGSGLPGTDWSTTHGDLRIPHFIGLHAVQVLPLVVMIVRRLRSGTSALTVRAIGWSYAAFFVVLLAQALHGEPLLAPHALTAAAFFTWGVATLLAVRGTFASVRINGGHSIAAGA